MTTFTIVNRWTGETMHTVEAETLKEAVIGLVATKANLGGANVPVVPQLHAKILAEINAGGTLDMRSWHSDSCQTTHCRAGWAIHLAGDAGYALEKVIGPAAAAAFIHIASCPHLEGKVPDFYADNEAALADIKRCAAIETHTD